MSDTHTSAAATATPAQRASVFHPPARVSEGAHISSLAEYHALYAQSTDPSTREGWWAATARSSLTWATDFTEVMGGGFQDGDVRWFTEGTLNACYNAVDRHVLAGRGGSPAVIHEGDEPGTGETVSYDALLNAVCRVANVLTKWGVRKGDTVGLGEVRPVCVCRCVVCVCCSPFPPLPTPGEHLPPHDPRDCVHDAGVRAHRRRALRRVCGVLQRLSAGPHLGWGDNGGCGEGGGGGGVTVHRTPRTLETEFTRAREQRACFFSPLDLHAQLTLPNPPPLPPVGHHL